MSKVRDFKDLRIWQQGIEIVKEIYLLSRHFPKEELFGLTSQMRRASVSIPSNIAEGHINDHEKVFDRHLNIALGSCAELETQIIISHDLGYVPKSETENILDKIRTEIRQILSLKKQLNVN